MAGSSPAKRMKICLRKGHYRERGKRWRIRVDTGAAGDPGRGRGAVPALRRRLLAAEGRGGRLSARIPPGDGRGRLARHRDAAAIWRQRARHHRGGGNDAGRRPIRRRVQRRLGDPHEHFRAAPGRRLRQRRAETPLSAAADRRPTKRPASPSPSPIPGSTRPGSRQKPSETATITSCRAARSGSRPRRSPRRC